MHAYAHQYVNNSKMESSFSHRSENILDTHAEMFAQVSRDNLQWYFRLSRKWEHLHRKHLHLFTFYTSRPRKAQRDVLTKQRGYGITK